MAQRLRKYRHWSVEEKQSICQQTRAPGVSVAQVARRYSMNANLIFKWLKDSRFAPAPLLEGPTVFLPIEIAACPPANPSPICGSEDGALRDTGLGCVDVTLPCGTRVAIGESSDPIAVVRLIKGLSS